MIPKLHRLLIFVSLLTVSTCHAECPSFCQCYQQSGINSISCVNTKLPEIPNYFDFEVKILNFTENHLPNLTDTFRNQHYKSLEILDLSRNSIANIDELSLFQLKNLLEIDFSYNRIQLVPARLFDNNRFLNTVHFRGNPIEELLDYAFSPSIYLRRLNFQGCRIRRIHKFAFVNVPLLEYLNLKDNSLTSLSLKVLHFTPQLGSLLLDGNPWHCDKKLWHLLKWMQTRNMANSSLLCVYGETEDAILWDTMDTKNALKFRDTRVPQNVRRIRWSSPAWNRPRRESVDVADGQAKLSRRSRDLTSGLGKSMGFDYSVDPPVEEEESEEADPEGEAEFYPRESRVLSPEEEDDENENHPKSHQNIPPHLTFDFSKNSDPKVTNDAAKQAKPMWRKEQQKPPDWAQSLRHSKQGMPHKMESSRSQPVDVSENSPNLQTQDETDLIKYHVDKVSVDYYTDDKRNADQSQDEKELNETNTDKVSANFESSEAEEGDGVNMKFMLLVIAVEFIMLAVLLFVLYKLWKSNKRGRDTEVNAAPLNNNKNFKTRDMQSPGYKRYSLSDDDCTDARKSNLDEAKFDSESGYLSYHRYNSIEGEAGNDGVHYRRNPREENDALSGYTNAELDSVNANRPEENESADRRMRRNSSMRSVGRRAKINLARRSYSDDFKHQGEDV